MQIISGYDPAMYRYLTTPLIGPETGSDGPFDVGSYAYLGNESQAGVELERGLTIGYRHARTVLQAFVPLETWRSKGRLGWHLEHSDMEIAAAADRLKELAEGHDNVRFETPSEIPELVTSHAITASHGEHLRRRVQHIGLETAATSIGIDNYQTGRGLAVGRVALVLPSHRRAAERTRKAAINIANVLNEVLATRLAA